MMSTTVDPLRLAARSVVSEVKTYDMLQSHQGISIPRCFGLYPTGFPEQDMCPAIEARCWDRFTVPLRGWRQGEVVVDYFCEAQCEAIFATLFRLTMDFMDLGVLQDDLAPRNVIIRPPARPEPFPLDERCLARLEPMRTMSGL